MNILPVNLVTLLYVIFCLTGSFASDMFGYLDVDLDELDHVTVVLTTGTGALKLNGGDITNNTDINNFTKLIRNYKGNHYGRILNTFLSKNFIN